LYRGAAAQLWTDNHLQALGFRSKVNANWGLRTEQASGGIAMGNVLLNGDANYVFYIMGDGKHWWGPGGAVAVDTNLYRAQADLLKTDDNLWVQGTLTNIGGIMVSKAAGTFGLNLNRTGDAQARLSASVDGVLNWGDGAVVGDTNLYRKSAHLLKTDDALEVAGKILNVTDPTLPQDAATKNYVDSLVITTPPPGCSISGVQSISSATATPIAAGTILRQQPSGSVTGGNTFTAPETGNYRIAVAVTLSAATTNTMAQASLWRDGVDLGNVVRIPNLASGGTYPTASGFIDLALTAGQQLTLQIRQDDGVTRSVTWRFSVDMLPLGRGAKGDKGDQGIPGSFGVVNKGSAFPASPIDGEQFDLQESVMSAAGVRWRFVYNAAKSWWEFVGGAPLIASSDSPVSTSSTTYVNQGDMTIDLPYLGRYDIRVEALLTTNNVAGNGACISIGYGSTVGIDAQSAIISTVAAVANTSFASAQTRVDISNPLNLNIKQSLRSGSVGAGTVTAVRQRKLIITPVRIPV